jgi:hypothetical protein
VFDHLLLLSVLLIAGMGLYVATRVVGYLVRQGVAALGTLREIRVAMRECPACHREGKRCAWCRDDRRRLWLGLLAVPLPEVALLGMWTPGVFAVRTRVLVALWAIVHAAALWALAQSSGAWRDALAR